MMELIVSMSRRDEAARRVDDNAWKLLESLTRDKRLFPKAVHVATVDTDIAGITIDGGSSKPITIRTGADGGYAVYADNYRDGIPGRIIIEIAHPVKKENAEAQRLAETEQPKPH